MSKIRIIGVDAAFSNMGFCKATLDIDTMLFQIDDLILVQTESRAGKTVRKNSDDMDRAKLLHQGLHKACDGASFAIAEIPVGAQNARAAWTLGAALGVMAGCPIPLIQVSPVEVKLATVGKKTASKAEMIDYAMMNHPHAPWLMRKSKGQMVPMNDNEHLADAVAVIYAGLLTDQFQQAIALMRGFRAAA